MNLREETIKVLRQCASDLIEAGKIIAADDGARLPITGSMFHDSAARVNTFLSRLEAGSGEETGAGRLPRQAAWFTHENEDNHHGHLYYFAPVPRTPSPYRNQRRVSAIIDIAADGTLAGVELIDNMPPPLNQEGGDAVAPGSRPHVATPAPGENSERAPIVQQLRSAVTASGGVDASAELLLTAATAIEVMARDWLADRKDNFTAGRRSMREEAAKVAENERDSADDSTEHWSATYRDAEDGLVAAVYRDACGIVATAIRAIPEKQS